MEQSVESKLTIYFEEPFWVGVFEELDSGRLSVCRMVFGAEPTDAEVYDFILKHDYHLRFSNPIKTEIREKADNPKRRQRNARKQLERSGVSFIAEYNPNNGMISVAVSNYCDNVWEIMRNIRKAYY